MDVEPWIWFYYNQGFSIIPLGNNKGVWGNNEDELKRPSIKSWDKYKETLATKEEIQQWINDDLFKGIAVICGKVSNNLVVIDIDDSSIPKLIDLKFRKIIESGSWVVETGNGFHIYCKHHSNPGGIKKPIRYKIEYRANNGYVVAPPSIHPSGKQYRFIGIEKPNELKPLEEKDVKSIFDELKKKIGKVWEIKETQHTTKGTTKTDSISDYPKCVEIALNNICKHPMRYYTIYGIASSFSLQHIPKDMAEKKIKEFNLKKCVPPHENHIIEQAIRGAYEKDAHHYGCEFWMDHAELCPYENIMECQFGKKKVKKELAQKYKIFLYKEIKKKGTDETFFIPDRVIPPRLAKLIIGEYDFNFSTVRDNQELYYFNDGIYHPDGETIISSIAEDFMDDLTSTFYKNETVGFIKDYNYINRNKFDANSNLINLKNGIYNLETKQLEPHTPDKYFLNELPIKYVEGAKCPKILKFLNEVIYPEDVATMQEFFGYCLYRRHHIHKACMFIGDGKNGKSTTINLLTRFIGGDNVTSKELYQLISDKFAIADIYGKLANMCADITSTALKKTGLFKALTGEDLVNAQKKFKGSFDFRNYAKFIFSANKLPESPDKTYAFYRRWILISFPNTFTGDKCDANILEKISTEEELSGLLNWALEGLERLLDKGDFSYNRTVEEVAEQYETLSDPVYAFVKEFLKETVGGGIAKEDVWDKYVKWCKEKTLSITPKNMLTQQLSKHLSGMRNGMIGGKGNQKPAFREISWKNEDEKDKKDDGMGGSQKSITP